jgi:hypothetical protein
MEHYHQPLPSFMEGYVTGEVTSALNTDGAERPGVRFCHPSASFKFGRKL